MDLDYQEDLVRRLAAATRATALYSADHPLVERNISALAEVSAILLADTPSVTVGFIGKEIVVNEKRLRTAGQLAPFASGLQDRGVERITFARGSTGHDVRALVETLAGSASGPQIAAELAAKGARSVGIGAIGGAAPKRKDDAAVEVARRIYSTAMQGAEAVWQAARAEGKPDPAAARSIISSLSQLVVEDRTRMMALTTLKRYDAYTFTHMVNVSVLTLAMARSLRIEGQMLSDFGLAALMHDIGKVSTPLEVLNKPDRLTPAEFEVMKRHVVDGAQILRRVPEIPPLAPLTAFEHHLRVDLRGYPENATPRPLNLCTMIVTIADTFDALRSHRPYRDALSSARVRALLTRDQRTAFNPVLLKRFVDLVGLYPVGQYVRLKSGEVALVTHENPQDAVRPHVKVIIDRSGEWLSEATLLDLAEKDEQGGYLYEVAETVDPAIVGVDPVKLL